MKFFLLTILLLTTAAHAAPQGPGGGTGGGGRCPNQKAIQVPGASEAAQGASVSTCGIGFLFFGFGGGIVGEDCPSAIVLTPAHQTCGEPGPETMCVPDGDMPVTAKECHCGGLVIPGLEIGIPTSCDCGPSFPFGTVEDAKTVLCPDEGDTKV